MMATCPECHWPLVASVFRPGLICPAAWGECSFAGMLVERAA
jgi:hypothetical protein